MRDHVRCPDCEGCATCGLHTAGVTCNGTSSTPGPIVKFHGTLTPELVSWFRERLEAVQRNPGLPKILPRDVTDIERIEAAIAVLERRYPGTRPETLQDMLDELRFIARDWRRAAAKP